MGCVFLSYRQESEAQKARVRDLAERLEKAGLTVVLDRFAQDRDFHGGGPNEGWPRWSKNQAGNPTHKVLIVASKSWFRCYEGKELAGTGLGAAAEAGMIEQRLYNAGGISPDIRIVTFEAFAAADIPLDLQRYHRFADPADFHDLVGWLTGTAPAKPTPVAAADWPETPPPRDWPVADHGPVRDAFGQLLTRSAPWRFLPVHGHSETGKSHVTRLMLGSALGVTGLACGRFDFKGTTNVELELQSLVMNLDVPLPATGPALNDRLAQVFAALKQRARPALLILDTYERAGDAQDWVEKHLLPHTVREAWLRVVIAGQRLPDRTGASWVAQAAPAIELKSPLAEDWFEFGRTHKPGLTLDFVRQAHACCNGKATTLAQLLGPAA